MGIIKEKTSTNDEWVQLNEYPNYEINRKGQLRSIKTGAILQYQSSTGRCGRVYKTLENKFGENKSPYIDELVAEVFLPNNSSVPNALLVHKDGNESNCSVDNLLWDDGSFSANKYYEQTGIKKPKEYFVFYPLAEFPDSVYEINMMGQIRNKTTNMILNGTLNDGYRLYLLRINKKTIARKAHILVAKQFIPNPENKPLVNHIDEDKNNPCIDNLEWTTPKDNILYGTAIERGNQGRYKPVNEYTIDGKYVRTWNSIKNIADFFDYHFPNPKINSHISRLNNVLSYNSKNNIMTLQTRQQLLRSQLKTYQPES